MHHYNDMCAQNTMYAAKGRVKIVESTVTSSENSIRGIKGHGNTYMYVRISIIRSLTGPRRTSGSVSSVGRHAVWWNKVGSVLGSYRIPEVLESCNSLHRNFKYIENGLDTWTVGWTYGTISWVSSWMRAWLLHEGRAWLLHELTLRTKRRGNILPVQTLHLSLNSNTLPQVKLRKNIQADSVSPTSSISFVATWAIAASTNWISYWLAWEAATQSWWTCLVTC